MDLLVRIASSLGYKSLVDIRELFLCSIFFFNWNIGLGVYNAKQWDTNWKYADNSMDFGWDICFDGNSGEPISGVAICRRSNFVWLYLAL